MLKNLKKYSVLCSISRRIKSKSIVDVILFGSAVKGKTEPQDIDIAVIFKGKADVKLIGRLDEACEKNGFNAHISSLVIDNFFTKPHSLIRAVFFEGISLLTDKAIAGNYGLTSWSVYNYNLTGLKKSERVRFVYVLKGRGREKGLIEEFKGKFLAPGCFIVPVEKDNEILDVLKRWKVKFERDKYMLMR
ncbi:nucleotidyltransferase domain-containing protein [Candidatus Woesearchaeota archaeon]|nr:nucleotidyltransferase domain-containing protein [Candidatus Woesearchaeota archaeon]